MMLGLWKAGLAVLFFLHFIMTVEGADCMTLDGIWYNQLGSQMILNHTKDGELIGHYRTEVEREAGTAGLTHSQIVGAAPYNKPGATFGFAVMFKEGESITSWTGQCLVCGEEEVLLTSWLLREWTGTCIDKWMSTRIGQDTFTRTQQTSVAGETLINTPAYSYSSHSVSDRHKRSDPVGIPCGLVGSWYNEMGSEVILHHSPNNYISGEYRTAVERSSGSAGNTHSKVYGLGNVYSGDTTFALFVVWRGGESVTGWVGQCHLCGEQQVQTLEVNWLLRSKVSQCEDNWRATYYGQNSFTLHEQEEGPRKRLGIHTPQQDGEDSVDSHLTCAGEKISTWMNLIVTVLILSHCLH